MKSMADISLVHKWQQLIGTNTNLTHLQIKWLMLLKLVVKHKQPNISGL